jgi:hypothetical protein
MTFYDVARDLHILCGTVALASFWTTAIMRKGTPRHRVIGRIYLIAISCIIVTAVPLAISAFQRDQAVKGAFLLYLIVITATPAWLAYSAIRNKRDIKRFTGPLYRALAVLSIVAGAITCYLGVHFDAFLLTAFSMVGILTGIFMLRYAMKPPTDRNWWLSRHYGSIIATGVATHVAFINLGLSHLIPPEWAQTVVNFSFLSPLALAIVVRMWLDRKYLRKPSKAPVAAGQAVA